MYGVEGFEWYFNERKMIQTNHPRIRIEAGRAFFLGHVWTYIYPYGLYIEDWVIAAAAWSGEKFTYEPNYMPPNFIGHEMRPFRTIIYPPLVRVKDAEGMSAMIKYLVDCYGESVLVQTTRQMRELYYIKEGLWSPTEAIIKSVDDPVNVWVPDFFKEYVSGNIYGVSSDVFTNPKNLAGVFNIKPEGEDTVEFFSAKYIDLSAKIYRINLPHSSKDIDSDAEIRFVVNSVDVALDDLTLLVFGLKDGRLQYFDDWTITNVKGLTEEGWDLIVVVVNSNYNKEDWKKLSEIELKVELVMPPEISDDVSSRFLAVLPADFRGEYHEYRSDIDPTYTCCFHFYANRDYPDDGDVVTICWSVRVDIHSFSRDDGMSEWWKLMLAWVPPYAGCTISDDRIVDGPYLVVRTYNQFVDLLYENCGIEIDVSGAPTKEECESVADAVEGVAKRIIDENMLTE